MKKVNRLFLVILTMSVMCSCNETTKSEQNPLLSEFIAPYGAPDFDKIKPEHYKPAMEQSIAEAKEEVRAIINNPDVPTFANTLEALEHAGERFSTITSIFFAVKEAQSLPEYDVIEEEMIPQITEYSMFVSLNDSLFQRIKYVYENEDRSQLNKEQIRLLEETFKSFARGGANLNEADKATYAKLSEELSLATMQFGNNALAATKAYALNITDSTQLAGLPASAVEYAASIAKERGEEGWTFTLDYPSYLPFMQYSENRELRRQIWEAYGSRCVSGQYSNDSLIHRIVELRTQIANILGFTTYADYALDDRMAKNQETVNAFLANLMEKSMPAARRDVEELKAYAAGKGFTEELMPWDFTYWSEKLQEEKYALNSEMLKPYFELNAVREAVLGLATRLYGITFSQRTDIPVYDPDVVVYEVKDGDKFMGLVYMDCYTRNDKRSGAWMVPFREQSIVNGEERRPFISLVTNFQKPTETTPSLLTFDDVTTLLHEFGHCLHGLLAEGTYGSLTGTNVARDFVELPSQINENWGYEREFLEGFAKHYQTGEVIPQEYIDKIIAAKNYHAGYGSVGQLKYATIDMNWHNKTQAPAESAADFEHSVLAPYQLFPQVEGVASSPAFSHIFSGGYAAGYYSYKWAEVLEADAFSLFKEQGIFNTEVAKSFRENILSKGNLEDADVLFRNFRGRDPRPEALLEKTGLIEESSEK